MNLVEVFSSVQGEGLHVGVSTLFVRFGECDLRCRWCDSSHTWKRASECRFETERGSGAFRTVPNPVSLDEVTAAADALDVASHRFVSLTGGEPLLQPEAVQALAVAMRARGPRIHLETHGLATSALEQVIDFVDVVAMDWKLASEVSRAVPGSHRASDFHEEHAAFLRVARRTAEVSVKVVVAPSTRDAEFDALCRAIAQVDRATPLVVQPVTPCGSVREPVTPQRLLSLAARAERVLGEVRLIPQTHKAYGAL